MPIVCICCFQDLEGFPIAEKTTAGVEGPESQQDPGSISCKTAASSFQVAAPGAVVAVPPVCRITSAVVKGSSRWKKYGTKVSAPTKQSVCLQVQQQ